MKVLLMNPPKHRLVNTDMSYFPLSLGALAASLEKNDIEVRIHNAELEDSAHIDVYPMSFVQATELQAKLEAQEFDSPNFDRILEEIRGIFHDYQPDMLGITCTSGDYPIARYIAEKVKEFAPDCTTVMGGSHVSALPEASLADSIDFILAGQADNSIVDLATLVGKGVTGRDQFKKIKGICFKDGDKDYLSSERDNVSVAELPIPSRHPLLFAERMRPNGYAHVMVSRGCPFSCKFCAVHAVHPYAVRYRNVDDVIAEIKELIFDFGATHVQFQDSIFNLNQPWVKEFCAAVKKNKLDFTWSINCHVNTLSRREEQLDMMRDAGLDLVIIGSEVDREELWSAIKKNIKGPDVLRLVDMLKTKNINHTVNIIYGFPFDDEENFIKRNEFMVKIDPQHIAANLFQPLPGTDLFTEWVTKNQLDVSKINYMRLATQSTSNNYTDIPYDRYLELVKEAYAVVDRINKKNQAYEEGFFFSQGSSRQKHISRPVGGLDQQP